MPTPFFPEIERIPFLGPDCPEPLAFRHYDKDRVVAGRRMEDHLRFAVCYWHTFCWEGDDVFGAGTFGRPWQASQGDPIALAERKLEVAFEFFEKLGVPFFCFHDRDLAPEGDSVAESAAILDRFGDLAAAAMERTGVKLLWGTANLFGHPRYAAGAATNPNPEVFACAAAQVKTCLDLTHRLGGANYVMWGGREGYEDPAQHGPATREPAARALHAARRGAQARDRLRGHAPHRTEAPRADQAPVRHDVAHVQAFLQKYGLEDEIKLNIEVNHATLAGHSFQHEVAVAIANDLFGSVDANRATRRTGGTRTSSRTIPSRWGSRSTRSCVPGGSRRADSTSTPSYAARAWTPSTSSTLTSAAWTRWRRRSSSRRGWSKKASSNASSTSAMRGWDTGVGREILEGEKTLAELEAWARAESLDPEPVSGRQERLENVVRRTRG